MTQRLFLISPGTIVGVVSSCRIEDVAARELGLAQNCGACPANLRTPTQPEDAQRSERQRRDTGRNGVLVSSTESTSWQDRIYAVLRENGVTQFAYVPDAGHRAVIAHSLADPDVHSVALTTEEEGVGLLAGADLGGARGVLLMQSSGAGNCINFLSLIKRARFPFLTILSMRGDFGEGNPWQMPMGQAAQPILESMGIICLRIDQPEDVEPTLRAAITMVFQAGEAVAVLLTQKLIGAKQF